MRTDNQRIRDNVLDEAIRAGKIAAADRDRYRRMYDSQPVETRRLLTARVEEGGLMPGLVGPGEDPATAAPGGYDPSWLSPQERQRVAAQQSATAPATGRESIPPGAKAPPLAPGAAPAAKDDEQYDPSWLSAQERQRIRGESPPSPARDSSPVSGSSAGGEQYPEGWLSPDERERIAAAREGRLVHDPVQFEGPEARPR